MDDSEHILSCSDSYLMLEEVQGILEFESSHMYMWVLPYCNRLRMCIISSILPISATRKALVSTYNCSLVSVSFYAIMCLAIDAAMLFCRFLHAA